MNNTVAKKAPEAPISERVSLATAAIGAALIIAFLVFFTTASIFLPAGVTVWVLLGGAALAATAFAASKVPGFRERLLGVRVDPLRNVHGPKEAWKELSSLVGVQQEENLLAQIRVAKLLAERHPNGLEEPIINAVLQSNFLPLVRAYWQISKGAIVDPKLQPDVGPKAVTFPGEITAARQTRKEAWQTLATLADAPTLTPNSESCRLIVDRLVRKFPHGLPPATVISAGIAGLLHAITQRYPERQDTARNPDAQSDAAIPSPRDPIVAAQANSHRNFNRAAMTHDEAWESIVSIANLPPQRETDASRAAVAEQLLARFPDGLGEHAPVAAKALLTPLIQPRYAEKSVQQERRSASPRQQSREL